MTSLIFGITLASLLSVTSFLIVILRVSPLLAPSQALTAFFLSLFMSIATVGTLIFMGVWKLLGGHAWDTGKLTSISLRQGIFLGSAVSIMTLFHLLDLLNWWIAVMIFGVFILVELALEH